MSAQSCRKANRMSLSMSGSGAGEQGQGVSKAKASAAEPDLADLLSLQAAYGPNIFASAAHNKVPEDAWEYHVRRSLNDAAYTTLSYVPYSSTMPVPAKCDEPRFMWRKKERS